MRLKNNGPVATDIASRARIDTQEQRANSAPPPPIGQGSVVTFPPAMQPAAEAANNVTRETAIRWIMRRAAVSREIATAILAAGNLGSAT